MSILIPIPKKVSAKECANNQTIALVSHASKVMLKILHARLQDYGKQELLDVYPGFRKGRGTRDKIATFARLQRKQKDFRKLSISCFIDYAKAFDYVDHGKLQKALREMGTPDQFTCLLRNLYVGQKATVRTLYGTTSWFRLRKEYDSTVCCHPICLTYRWSTS